MHHSFLWLHPLDPAQDLRWAVAAILPLLVRRAPCVFGNCSRASMYREPKTASSHVCALIFAPVSHTSLHAKRCFSVILLGFSFFDLLFLDAELRTYPPGVVGKKDAASIRDQHAREHRTGEPQQRRQRKRLRYPGAQRELKQEWSAKNFPGSRYSKPFLFPVNCAYPGNECQRSISDDASRL